MFLIHPILQCVGIVCVVYAWHLGIQRFRMQHMGQKKVRFQWKRHVRFGLLGMAIFIAGISVALYVVKTSWHAFLVTGLHGKLGLVLIPFILFAVCSGLYMDRRKKKRRILPLAHGILNTLMLLLVLYQLYTGIWVYQTFVSGY